MKTRYWIAAAVLAAVIPTSAAAQGQPTSPVAPRAGTAAASPDGKIAVINTGVFMERIQELKSKQDQVSKKYEPRVNALRDQQAQINKLQNDIKAQANVVPPEKLQQMQDQLQQLQRQYNRAAEDLQGEIGKEGEALMQPVRQKLSDFVKAYATQRNIIMILDLPGSYNAGMIAFYNQAIDITDDFINEYNRANPVPGATSAARPGTGQ
jgi:Skp family chaperone for outer membrane proteins